MTLRILYTPEKPEPPHDCFEIRGDESTITAEEVILGTIVKCGECGEFWLAVSGTRSFYSIVELYPPVSRGNAPMRWAKVSTLGVFERRRVMKNAS